MAQIYNSDLSKELIQGASIQVNRDLVPNQLAEKVVPVMEVNPKMLRTCNLVKSGSFTNATSTLIYTTPSDKDFYLTHLSFSYVKDVTATAVTFIISCTPEDGIGTNILGLNATTLTIEKDNIVSNYSIPIKLKRNSSINMLASTNVGNFFGRVNIIGFVVENQIN